MPIHKAEHFGTDRHGRKSEEYCKYCFQHGNFTEPNLKVQEMINKCVGFMVNAGVMPEPHLRDMFTEVIPKLKRWQVLEPQYELVS
jgi:hypothetical protein